MEFFHRAKVVRLRSQHNKFLTAIDDEEGVKQTRNGSSKAARWAVEMVEGKPNVIRLKSCETWKYLSATDEPFLLGMTGKKVLQVSPRARSDPSVEWEPLKEGSWVRLRTRKGDYLRANSGIPPWKNSVTHDVPSRTAMQDWILWMVDIIEVDFQYDQSSPPAKKDDGVDRKVAEVKDQGKGNGDQSRVSRVSSSASRKSVAEPEREDGYKNYNEVGPPARSGRSSKEIPEPSPDGSPKSAEVSSVSQHVRQESQISETGSNASSISAQVSYLSQHVDRESQHSNSFNKLRSMLDGLNDLLDDKTKSDAEGQSSVDSVSPPHSLDVKMAKQVLNELQNTHFVDIMSSGRVRKLEKAVDVLVADAKMLSGGEVPIDLIDLQDRLKSMRNDHELASQDLVECTNFSTRRLEMRAELKKDAAKAHELEQMEVGFTNMLATARAKREMLLKQLEEVENSIRAAERAQADNALEIEELISRIGEKSENLREIERQEKTMRTRKVEAERTLERVEKDWVHVKSLFQDVCDY